MQLIQYLQAYDLLKTGGIIGNDINSRNDSPRENLRKFTSELYSTSSRIINSNIGWKKNHGIISCSGLGMASLILGQAGGRRDEYDPNKWFQRAHGRKHNAVCLDECDDGLEDNFFVGRQAGNDVPTTNSDGTAGFSEGPNYFLDLSMALFPYMRCNSNSLSSIHNFNLLKDYRYVNMLKWYYNILNVDGQFPQYDNSKQSPGNIFGILGLEEFKGHPTKILTNYSNNFTNIDMRGDYLLSLGFLSGQKPDPEDYYNEKSGNFILFDETSKGKFTLHTLFETGVAVDKPGNGRDGTHEDDDFGSFTIDAKSLDDAALNMPLIIDPGYDHRVKFNNFSLLGYYGQHNTIESSTIGGQLRIGEAVTEMSKVNGILGEGTIRGRKLGMTANNFFHNSEYFRTLLSWNFDNQLYYTVQDELVNNFVPSLFLINITGNGSHYFHETSDISSPRTFRKEGEYHIYSSPCAKYSGNSLNQWRVLHTYLAINNNGNQISEDSHTYTPAIDPYNEATREILTAPPFLTSNAPNDDYYNSSHTQLELKSNSTRLNLLSIYIPIKCEEELPFNSRSQRTGLAYLTLGFKEQLDTSASLRKNLTGSPQFTEDTSAHFHLIKETNTIDTIINPFKFKNDSAKVLSTDANRLFINYRAQAYLGKSFGFCEPAYTRMRSIAAWNSTTLTLQSDTFIQSTIPLDISFGIASKNYYDLNYTTHGEVTAYDSVRIQMFGVERGIELIGLFSERDTLASRYDSINKVFIFNPREGGPFHINIKPTNPCLDCYFPPNGTNFDTLFIANSKNQHTLGNSKKINANHGNLSIVNSTKVNMCAGVILHNKDSLIIEGPAQSMPMRASSCAGIDSLIKGSDNSMLIVSPYAALVLDAGSHTYVKKGAGLYIKQNGSLIVKSGALLEVGDSGTGGWGEIIAEPGAFIYIEDNAVIRYRRRIGDTSDNNTINFAVGNGGVIAGVQFYIDSILKADTILPASTYPIAICALDTINPIGNPSYGYTNFGRPQATAFTRSFLCPQEPFSIKLNRLLNDAQLEISVCRVDSVWRKNQDGNWHWKDTCINDSIVLDSMPPDPSCLALS
jgi:hypothetical protein